MASTVPDLLFGVSQPFLLKHADNSVGAKTLPGKTDHQLFGTQLQLRTLVGLGQMNRPWCRRRAASQIPRPS